jgi:hypothetical protein
MYGHINVYRGMDVDTEHIHSCTMITADQQELKSLVVSYVMGRILENKTPIFLFRFYNSTYIGGLTGIVLQIVV